MRVRKRAAIGTMSYITENRCCYDFRNDSPLIRSNVRTNNCKFVSLTESNRRKNKKAHSTARRRTDKLCALI